MHPREYYESASERYQQAQALLVEQRHGLALLLAGIAAECVLRALLPPGGPFESRHDLRQLAQEVRFYPTDDLPTRVRVSGAINVIYLLWRSDYRYYSEAKIQRHIRELGWYKKPKGPQSFLKLAARDVLEAVSIVMEEGERRWASRTK